MIADYAMAEMNGIELAEAARARRPDLPIVIMTGYSDSSAIDAQIPNALLLKKPYRLADLAARVQSALWPESDSDSAKVVSPAAGAGSAARGRADHLRAIGVA